MSNSKTSLWRTSLFFTILIVIFFFFSANYEFLIKNDKAAYLRVIETFLKKNPKVVFLGDSHPNAGISENDLSDNYAKLSHGGDNLRQMILKLEYAKRTKPEVKFAVIPLDYHTFSDYRNRNLSFARDLNYTDNYALIRNLYNPNKITLYKELLSYYVPLTNAKNWEKYFLIISDCIERKFINSPDSQGVSWVRLSKRQKRHFARSRVDGQFRQPIVVSDMVMLLDNLIEFCHLNHIKLIGVRYPMSKEYVQYFKNLNIAKIDAIYENRENHFFEMLDYMELFIELPQYFLNSDHLNYTGARVFTKILIEDLDQKIFNQY
jgi:hypothetical protein